MDRTEGDVTGKKQMVREEICQATQLIFKSIALLQSFNLYERNTDIHKKIPKPKVEQSKASYLLKILATTLCSYSYYSIAIGYRT